MESSKGFFVAQVVKTDRAIKLDIDLECRHIIYIHIYIYRYMLYDMACPRICVHVVFHAVLWFTTAWAWLGMRQQKPLGAPPWFVAWDFRTKKIIQLHPGLSLFVLLKLLCAVRWKFWQPIGILAVGRMVSCVFRFTTKLRGTCQMTARSRALVGLWGVQTNKVVKHSGLWARRMAVWPRHQEGTLVLQAKLYTLDETTFFFVILPRISSPVFAHVFLQEIGETNPDLKCSMQKTSATNPIPVNGHIFWPRGICVSKGSQFTLVCFFGSAAQTSWWYNMVRPFGVEW